MDRNWIALQSIPPTGKTLILDDQALWQTPIGEFCLDCRIVEPVKAELLILPQEDGVLFRGRIEGKVSLPCDRCAADSEVVLSHNFDSFESFPAEEEGAAPKGKKGQRPQAERQPRETQVFDDSVDNAVIRVAAHGRGIEINPAALCWEEFSLALPIKPLCSEECRGLCPVCGNNLNVQQCSCPTEKGDPRLAALRGVKVAAKK